MYASMYISKPDHILTSHFADLATGQKNSLLNVIGEKKNDPAHLATTSQINIAYRK